MFKVAYIGNSGHGPLAYNGSVLHHDVVDFVAIAPGSEGESVQGMFNALVKRNTEEGRGVEAHLYEDYNEMLAKEEIDICVVDNFYGDHAKAIVAALEKGCHVFAEKPLATTLEDLEKIKAAYEKAHREHGAEMIAMLNFRYTPAFWKAYQMVQEGVIGEVRLINGQKSYKFGTRPNFAKARATYGGTIPWVGIHAIDWINWFSGQKFVSATAAQSTVANNNNGDLETDAMVLYELGNEVLGSVTMDYLNPTGSKTWGDDRVRIVGTKGVLEVRHGKLWHLRPLNEGEEAMGQIEIELEPEKEIFEDFLDFLEGKGPIRLTAEDSIATTEAALRAQLSADTGKKVFFE